ncbi:MAG: beta-lactamase family protein [Acidobacteria bacterium]|nr:beta-lactamase family protein [Acidobacteriota bacterium]
MDIEQPIKKYLPEFDGAGKDGVTVKHLLSHTSGLAAWKPFYLLVDQPNEIVANIAATPLDYRTGSRVVYSDANFILLGRIIEKLYSLPLDRVVEDEIADQLGLWDTGFHPAAELRPRIAACEHGNGFERQTCEDLGFAVELRKIVFEQRRSGARSTMEMLILWAELRATPDCFRLRLRCLRSHFSS